MIKIRFFLIKLLLQEHPVSVRLSVFSPESVNFHFLGLAFVMETNNNWPAYTCIKLLSPTGFGRQNPI
jgi:hypothetical protein